MSKEIKSANDLAIHGALPAFQSPKYVGSPNLGSKKKFLDYVDQIYEANWLTNNGPFLQELENKIADYHNVKNCIAICNGTVAMEIAIKALDLRGEVIIPSYTFIATAHALAWQQVKPVFADINPITHSISPESVKSKINSKTTGIIGVHLWGRAANVDELIEISESYKLKLIFDSAHAFGISYKGRKIGGFGNAEVLSFHATKFFNTFEGGAILTNDDQLADKMRLMRNFGFSGFDNVIHLGTNGKMTEISAAMGLVNLDYLDEVLMRNKENYFEYKKHLDSIPQLKLFEFDENEINNYQYILVQLDRKHLSLREKIIDTLHKENVIARKYFWPGCHKMKPYVDFPEFALPITNDVANSVIVLPTGSNINSADIDTICKILKVSFE